MSPKQGQARKSVVEFLAVEGFGQEEALVLEETTAAVEFDGWVAVVDLEVQEFCVVLARGTLGEIEKLRANSLPAVRGFNKEFVNPGAFAAVFQAVFEADHQITDRGDTFASDVGYTINWILHEFGKIRAERGFVEGFRPGVVELKMAHHLEQGFEVGEGGLGDGNVHRNRGA